MPRDTSPLGLQATGFRLRRTHEKSRNGCTRCKQQRKKCDELRPSCSRCTKRAYKCRYQNPLSDSNLSDEEGSTYLPVPNLHLPSRSGVATPDSPHALSSDHLSFPSPASGGPRLSADEDGVLWNPRSPATLDATELGLLAHYLTHTSQTIPFDDLDLYALSVGVPNLAFKCRVVMSSLLALAAACKSHDIARQARNPLDTQDLMDIQELLALAERHHRDSLRHIQVALHNSESYDYLLANAALMVLYASANHSIRVHLAATAKQYGRQLPAEVYPQHSQWISFTRAAHTASTAILNDIVDATTNAWTPVTNPPIETQLKLPKSVLSPQDGPSEKTKRLFSPIVASTSSRAIESLRRRAESTTDVLKTSQLSDYDYQQLQASLETLSMLENCACTALSTREEKQMAELPQSPPISVEQLARVSPWVARYMISVTSMESPQALRRIIMSFLNKAPAEYLSLVQSVLDSPPVNARAEKWMSRDSPGSDVPPLNPIHLLALDIFAHWLVLLMLLDGVWWIGDIGQWELGQIISLMKTQNLPCQSDTGETWWPESMYLVKRELTSNA
ncbi:hypothetical protein FE257_001504 [Aspergillus nanangensis]|uniref:Zn(2)-C6 fungal-type domain-containing protein n=1 Tax=Aspergillus nanangensis TaxID=2582783 RepID=A0AAD4CDN8_ASPNN|nr:hypothetical protein FE257_001504 [Aspergillus nanangensis]